MMTLSSFPLSIFFRRVFPPMGTWKRFGLVVVVALVVFACMYRTTDSRQSPNSVRIAASNHMVMSLPFVYSVLQR